MTGRDSRTAGADPGAARAAPPPAQGLHPGAHAGQPVASKTTGQAPQSISGVGQRAASAQPR